MNAHPLDLFWVAVMVLAVLAVPIGLCLSAARTSKEEHLKTVVNRSKDSRDEPYDPVYPI